jgi:hypothetical protein
MPTGDLDRFGLSEATPMHISFWRDLPPQFRSNILTGGPQVSIYELVWLNMHKQLIHREDSLDFPGSSDNNSWIINKN